MPKLYNALIKSHTYGRLRKALEKFVDKMLILGPDRPYESESAILQHQFRRILDRIRADRQMGRTEFTLEIHKPLQYVFLEQYATVKDKPFFLACNKKRIDVDLIYLRKIDDQLRKVDNHLFQMPHGVRIGRLLIKIASYLGLLHHLFDKGLVQRGHAYGVILNSL